jgi:hypothetical protein
MLYVVAYYQELFQIAAPGVAMRGFWSRLPSLSPKSLSAWPTQVADHLVPNQVLGFFEFFREREGGRVLFSKACKSLYRRRFRKTEYAPLAASDSPHFSRDVKTLSPEPHDTGKEGTE